MVKSQRLTDFFQLSSHFTRSIHLESDFYSTNQEMLENYVVTVTTQKALESILRSLEKQDLARAWSVIGAYGSGKSSFALFLSKLLGSPSQSITKRAREILKKERRDLWDRLVKLEANSLLNFCPVLITGSKSSITPRLLDGLFSAIKWFYSDGIVPHSIEEPIKNLIQKNRRDGFLSSGEIDSIYRSTAEYLYKESKAKLFLVIDELGKFLEFAVDRPNETDIFVLQELAVSAERSREKTFLVLTILHQTIIEYAEYSPKSQIAEWEKIQGRFEEIPFLEPTDQVVRLISNVIRQRKSPPKLDEFSLILTNNLLELGLVNPTSTDDKLLQSLIGCLPLHPTVSLILGKLFHQIAQNERSIFVFLAAGEPHSLLDFIRKTLLHDSKLPLFTLPELYDYVTHTLGSRLYSTFQGKKWAEVETVLQRQKNPSEIRVRLIKTIGFLGILGEPIANLRASKEMLHFSLDNGTANVTSKTIDLELRALEKQSTIVYRKYNKAYAIWEGSDIDIESAIQQSENEIHSNFNLREELNFTSRTNRPIVAHRHSFKTGTLRFFTFRYTDLANIESDLDLELTEADGTILCALPENQIEREQLKQKISKFQGNRVEQVVVAIPPPVSKLRELVRDISRIDWVRKNTPGLDSDATARRELEAIYNAIKKDFEDQLDSIFVSGADLYTSSSCQWFYCGEELSITSRSDLNSSLSTICDRVFCEAPMLRNELINRHEISIQATNARRKLVHAMITHEGKKELDISGYPPEKSIYLSLLHATKIHRYYDSKWGFFPPVESDSQDMFVVWQKINQFFSSCHKEKRPVIELYQSLANPPIGLRKAPISIIFCAFLIYSKREIGLYENGSFIPDLTLEIADRLLKLPERFEIKNFKLAGIKADVFEGFLSILNQSTSNRSDSKDLLVIVKPIIRFIGQLPSFTKITNDLSQNAINLRQAILRSQEPDHLIFSAIPKALGFPELTNHDDNKKKDVNQFFVILKDSLLELEQAYKKLMDSNYEFLAKAFRLDLDIDYRNQLENRFSALSNVVIENQLKVLGNRICDSNLEFDLWLESVVTYLANKPPHNWNDDDKVKYQIRLSDLARRFIHFETVYFGHKAIVEKDMKNFEQSEAFRIGITTLNEEEKEKVVSIGKKDSGKVQIIENRINKLLDEEKVKPELRLALLAKLSQKLIDEISE